VAELGAHWGQHEVEKSGPITFIGSGVNLNVATENGLRRAAAVTGPSYEEVLNRATITGSIEVSRLPGTVRAPSCVPLPFSTVWGSVISCGKSTNCSNQCAGSAAFPR
jgi:formamidase